MCSSRAALSVPPPLSSFGRGNRISSISTLPPCLYQASAEADARPSSILSSSTPSLSPDPTPIKLRPHILLPSRRPQPGTDNTHDQKARSPREGSRVGSAPAPPGCSAQLHTEPRLSTRVLCLLSVRRGWLLVRPSGPVHRPARRLDERLLRSPCRGHLARP
ncbi:hypothetical protein CDD83_1267 [Cordyceps sp. RAO-2017]|nr:hypothetical protein CDD83_1267 [Cordyceps sp. RAO-2017]